MPPITDHDQATGPPLVAGTATEKSDEKPASTAKRFLHWGANVVVVGMFVGFVVWGYSVDWKMPKVSQLLSSRVDQADDWCHEHNVPESQCIECKKDLIGPTTDYGWCAEHGIAQCPLHHPELVQTKTPPHIAPQDFARVARALTLLPRAENNSRCPLHTKRIQFASAAALDKVGVDIAVVEEQPLVEALTVNGEVNYDQTRSARLASRVPGTIGRVERRLGETVKQGDVLALIDSADIGRAKAELLQAIADTRLKRLNVDRLKPLATEGSVSGRQFRDAEAASQESQIRLLSAQQTLANLGMAAPSDDFANQDLETIAARIRYLGIPEAMAADLARTQLTSNLYPLRAPFDGVLVDVKATPGELADTTSVLFCVADTSRMSLALSLRQEDVRYLAIGQRVLFRPSDRSGEAERTGTLSWISTAADERTRMVTARAELSNPNGELRAGVFGTGRILLREEPKAIVVPSEAVHSDGCCQIVFVRDKHFFQEGSPKYFHIRKVRTGVKSGNLTEIIVGLWPGEVIASKNSVVLEAQLLKSNLGAGCACCEK